MKYYKKHYDRVSVSVEKIIRLLEHLVEEHKKIDVYHSVCTKDDGPVIA